MFNGVGLARSRKGMVLKPYYWPAAVRILRLSLLEGMRRDYKGIMTGLFGRSQNVQQLGTIYKRGHGPWRASL